MIGDVSNDELMRKIKLWKWESESRSQNLELQPATYNKSSILLIRQILSNSMKLLTRASRADRISCDRDFFNFQSG